MMSETNVAPFKVVVVSSIATLQVKFHWFSTCNPKARSMIPPLCDKYLVTVPELDSVTERDGVIISGFRTNVFLSARMESDVLVSMIGRTHVCPSSRVCSKISISLVFSCKLMIL